VPGAQHVHPEDPQPDLVGGRLEVGMRDDLRRPGVVDQHVDPAELGLGRGGQCHAGVVVGDVGLHVDGLGQRVSDGLSRRR
jgi:hypothetical protein